MRFLKRLLAAVVPGAAIGAGVVALAEWLLRNLDEVVRWVGGIAKLEEGEIAMYAQIVGQLKDAELVLPWVEAILIGCALNVVLAVLISRGKIRKVVINVLLLIPAVAAVLWFTKVNGIMLGDMIRQLIPILQSGLL